MNENKIELLIQNRVALSKKQRQLLDYMLEHINLMEDTGVDEVAKRAQVGKATIFRMLKEWEFSGFTPFKLAVSGYVNTRKRPAYWQVQEMLSNQTYGDSGFEKTLTQTAKTLDLFHQSDLSPGINRVVELMLSAPEIGVVGCRTSNLVTQYFEALMLPTPLKVTTLSSLEHFVFDRILKLPPKSAVLLLARWPYTRMTIKAAEYASSLGHSIIILTNSQRCSAKEIATEMLVLPHIEEEYSIVPFVMVLETIVNELCQKTAYKTLENMQKSNDMLEEHGLLDWG